MARRFLSTLWGQSVGIAASLFLLGCDPNAVGVPENTAATCSDGQDNDLDGSPDCFDLDCIDFANCVCVLDPANPICGNNDPEICSGGVDEDLDGFIDCFDTDCDLDPACDVTAENCNNNDVDDDGDGLADCDDPGCAQNPLCTANPGGGEGGGPASTCFDGTDNDNDGDANCDDSECTDECNGANTPEICTNNIDDNFDGRIDCADPQCSSQPNCAANGTEICFDGIDNDGVNGIDCSDVDCFADPACGGGGGFFEICGNGIDDDGIGGADCADISCIIDPTAGCLPEPGECNPNLAAGFDCFLDPQCLCATDFNCLFFDPCCGDVNSFECTGIAPPEICNNNTDDDFDGVVDCNDSDCAAALNCQPEICDDTTDNNGNGQTDCADAQCANSNLCVEICLDGIDNDADNQLDCADAGCVGSADCTETGAECSDAADNDQDGQADCADVNCFGDAACTETGAECSDGQDNDADNATDCADGDCANDAACVCGVVSAAQLGNNSGTTVGSSDLSAGSCQTAFQGGDGGDVAFSLTAPATGFLRFNLSSATDQGVYLQTTCANTGSEVGCADNFVANVDEGLVIPASGQNLSVLVGAFEPGDEAAFTLTIFVDPGTGICAAPFTAINSASTSGANNAGNNTGAPNIDDGSCQQAGGADVVFQFTPTATTAALILVAEADLGIFVQSGSCGNGTEIGCIDDEFGGTAETLNLTGLTVGTPVFVFVGGFAAGEASAFSLFIR